MNKIHKVGVIVCVVTGALVGGAGVTAANAQPISAPTAAMSSSGALRGPLSPVSIGGTEAPAGQAPAGGETRGLPIGSIVNWIKSNAPSIVPALKDALRSGIKAFTNWWNGLAGWIRTTINQLAQLSLTELFDQLWHYFFG
ncbi:hypothetical protein [Curtobacterium sp. Leaf261]|uniref:hypothetical protein n=1 Tax=Curtobacterium sp. Leaf261 TaxID=1736311 RepID=UPI0007128FF6|nr:hypothetical protein [Curtobacterium sp. Leaf261]KQO63597.1 hypothetical protein ASF23_05025 [Curtobacterium sp. Leaf261]